LIESENDHTMDLQDMELKIKAHPQAKYMLVSHMRGKLCDMDKVKELCDAHGIVMIEDCAHSVGVHWDGVHTGHHAVVACFSCQSNKALNSGEGGFLCTGVHMYTEFFQTGCSRREGCIVDDAACIRLKEWLQTFEHFSIDVQFIAKYAWVRMDNSRHCSKLYL
jgi:kynureninase